MSAPFGILRFHEQYFERIWGGHRLRDLLGKPTPPEPIGEAWLISDHPSAPSIISEGPHAGRSLHELVEEDPVALLGTRDFLTPGGRFPLLLKILDADQPLSVQVHPDDALAAALNEPDVGKTEMWYVLHAAPDAELIVGVKKGVSESMVRESIARGSLERHLLRRRVEPGESVFVEAGTVHAIGAGIVLAEIQQNSDLTYRLYDWNRVDEGGKSRELHIEKGLRATKLAAEPVWNTAAGIEKSECNTTRITPLSSSDYFSATHIWLQGEVHLSRLEQFFILFSIHGDIAVSTETERLSIKHSSSILLPACLENVTIAGKGEVLLYAPGTISF